LIQNSGVIIDSSNNISTSGSLTLATYFSEYVSSNIAYLAYNRNYVYSLRIVGSDNSTSAIFDVEGQALLFYSNSLKLETVSGGVHITGYLLASGNIRGGSDVRLKENIYTVEDALDKTMKLRPVYFDWKKDKSQSIGFIAQEVDKVEPRLVGYNDGYYDLAYGNITALCVGSIQKHDNRIKELEREIEFLKEELKRIA